VNFVERNLDVNFEEENHKEEFNVHNKIEQKEEGSPLSARDTYDSRANTYTSHNHEDHRSWKADYSTAAEHRKETNHSKHEGERGDVNQVTCT
jgi:hypothetical protein